MDGVFCAACGSPLVTITLRVDEGALAMHSCARCDHRSWTSDGAPVDLDLVLDELAEADAARSSARNR